MHDHSDSHSDCCGARAEGKDTMHVQEAEVVRRSWLVAAMTEAEKADRASGVWDLAPDKWEPGDMVHIEGLKARADLNGTTGVLMKWNAAASRWAVTVLASDEKVKVRPENLRRVDAAEAAQVLNAEAAVRTPIVLQSSAGTSLIAAQLAAEQYVVIDGFLQVQGGAVRELLRRLRGSGELQQGEVAGGRAAALEARILGQPLPRGDLMRFLEADEVAEHSELVGLLQAMDQLVEQLARAPVLAEEMAGCIPLRREEVQLTCYPGDGTQYVRHVDNNDETPNLNLRL